MSEAPPKGSAEAATERGPALVFGEFFYGLRQAGITVGVGEWMALMEVLSKGHVAPSLRDFYSVARALLVKHEAHFDTYDQVFSAVFAGEGEIPTAANQALLDWLRDPIAQRQFTEEELAALERLPLEKLRELFEERLKEQQKRHDGGNRWIGTGGTSPFGHGGQNPAGIRVGGSGGGRSAVQIAQQRRYADYRNDRVLDTRSIAVALRKLRRLGREDGEPELDVDASIDATCKNAGFLHLEFAPPRENQARVLLLMDVGGSMTPYTRVVERLFSAASHLNHWKKMEAFFFHNCVYSRVWNGRTGSETELTADLVKSRPKNTFLIMVGDASMAPSELLSPHGAIDWFERSETAGMQWLHRLRSHFTRAVWLNPMEPAYWNGYTVQLIGSLFDMFPLTLAGLGDAVDHLLQKRSAPVPELDPQMFREIW